MNNDTRMVVNIRRSQHNCKVVRRFQEDIWGRFTINNKATQVLKFITRAHQQNFLYRKLLSKRFWFLRKKIRSRKKLWKLKRVLMKRREKFVYKVVTDEQEIKRLRHSLKAKFYFSMLKLRRFYGNLKKRNFKRVFKERGLSDKFLMRSFGYFLESRLDVILYRSNFFSSIFTARQFITHKKIFVNGVLETKPGLKVILKDLISIPYYKKFYFLVRRRLKRKKLFVNYPMYLYVNYKLGIIMMWKLPVLKQIPYPFFLDLDKVTSGFLK
jgi:ribosomal protein S4